MNTSNYIPVTHVSYSFQLHMNGTITSSNKLLHLWQSLFDNVCNVLDFAIGNEDPCLVTEFFVVLRIITPVYFADIRKGSFFQVVQRIY